MRPLSATTAAAILLICLVAACGGDSFSPTPDDVFGHWRLTDDGASRVYLNEPRTCRVSFDVEITSDTVSKFVAPDTYEPAYLAYTGPDGMIRCSGDGAAGEEPFLRDVVLLVVIDGSSIEFWHLDTRLMYAGEIASRSRMGGSIPQDYWNRDGTWLALRR